MAAAKQVADLSGWTLNIESGVYNFSFEYFKGSPWYHRTEKPSRLLSEIQKKGQPWMAGGDVIFPDYDSQLGHKICERTGDTIAPLGTAAGAMSCT